MTRQLKAIQYALAELRKLDPVMPIQQAHAFLVIALQEGLSPCDLASYLGTTTASATRHAQALGGRHRSGKPGLGLIRTEDDDKDHRKKTLWLTQEGKDSVSRLALHINLA